MRLVMEYVTLNPKFTEWNLDQDGVSSNSQQTETIL